jgi:hypothetical protein
MLIKTNNFQVKLLDCILFYVVIKLANFGLNFFESTGSVYTGPKRIEIKHNAQLILLWTAVPDVIKIRLVMSGHQKFENVGVKARFDQGTLLVKRASSVMDSGKSTGLCYWFDVKEIDILFRQRRVFVSFNLFSEFMLMNILYGIS